VGRIRDARRAIVRAPLVVLMAGGGACAPSASKPVNVLLIVVDTLRADHTSLYGYPRRTTPNVDRLARDAVV
jgi:glucan phosphoethanolaminetransferase (alkaline phosphatase superfamily)